VFWVKAFVVGGFNIHEPFSHILKSHTPLTPLQMATVLQSPSMVEVFLKAGVDPNIKTEDGNTALHYAIWTESIAIVESLLAAQTDPNIRNESGKTSLHYAARIELMVFTQALLAARADPNIRDLTGQTPLHYAVRQRSLDVVEALLAAQADPNIRNEDGQTSLHKAADLPVLDALLRYRGNVDAQDNYGTTALHQALDSFPPNNARMAQRLIAANASLSIRDAAGNSPFDIAAGLNYTEINEIFANRLLSQSFESRNEKLGVGSGVSINSPLTLTNNQGLCYALLNSVDDFYHLLDKFKNPGFALGFDILPIEDIQVLAPLDTFNIRCFTGT
jgi:ankyrin repeat protein